MTSIALRRLTSGAARGILLKLSQPLSLWGGFDIATGNIIDATHPQRGECLSGRLIVMRGARGSSSSSSTLVEAARRGTSPAAIILGAADPVLVIGSLVAAELYGVHVPLLLFSPEIWDALEEGALAVLAEGSEALQMQI
jgi:predicted aconitase with swiveling domain